MTAFDPIKNNSMDNISQHVSYAEATVSATGSRLGIKNVPPPDIIDIMKITAAKLLEPIRTHFGVPVRVISFYRSPALNKAVGGAAKSQHMTGEAMDLQMTQGVPNAQLFQWLKDSGIECCQVIWEFGTDKEPDWVHVSYSTVTRKNNREFLRAKRVKGKTVYTPF